MFICKYFFENSMLTNVNFYDILYMKILNGPLDFVKVDFVIKSMLNYPAN